MHTQHIRELALDKLLKAGLTLTGALSMPVGLEPVIFGLTLGHTVTHTHARTHTHAHAHTRARTHTHTQ